MYRILNLAEEKQIHNRKIGHTFTFMTYQINLLKYLCVRDSDQGVLWIQLEENCLLQTKPSFSKADNLQSNIFFIYCNSRELHLYRTPLEKVSRHAKEIQEAQENLCILYNLLSGLS